ncbi:MAG: LysM peptidoglycan-binding domain-containing protein [Armatimonadetes bacterium]|nr:LysM peptidoglycan-binding domain-containing protein [Armatimonadota bacterium]
MGYTGKRLVQIECGLWMLAVCLLCAMAGLYVSDLRAGQEELFTYARVRVQEGESLWKIVKAWSEPGENILEQIARVKSLNRLEGQTLRPGQKLLIPVSAETAARLSGSDMADRILAHPPVRSAGMPSALSASR